MKFSEFLERYRTMDDGLIPDLNLKSYITIGDKVRIVQTKVDRVNVSVGIFPQASEFVKTREILKFFTLLSAYAGIEISDEDVCEENYDACQAAGVEKLLVSNIPIYEYKKFEKILDDVAEVNDIAFIKDLLEVPDIAGLQTERETLESELSDNAELINKLFDLVLPPKK